MVQYDVKFTDSRFLIRSGLDPVMFSMAGFNQTSHEFAYVILHLNLFNHFVKAPCINRV